MHTNRSDKADSFINETTRSGFKLRRKFAKSPSNCSYAASAISPPATRPARATRRIPAPRGGGKDATLAAPAQVDSHGEVPVAAVRVEAVVPQGELHQRDVRGVHALQGDAGRADVPAGFRDQVLQRLQHLLQDGALDQASLEHGCCGDGSGWSGRDAVMRVTPSGVEEDRRVFVLLAGSRHHSLGTATGLSWKRGLTALLLTLAFLRHFRVRCRRLPAAPLCHTTTVT